MIPKEVWTIVGKRTFGPIPGIRDQDDRIPDPASLVIYYLRIFTYLYLGLFSSFSPFSFSLPLLFSFLKYISQFSFYFLTDAYLLFFYVFKGTTRVLWMIFQKRRQVDFPRN